MHSTPSLLVTGASGLVGQALAARRPIVPLSRRPGSEGDPWWDPDAATVHNAPPLIGGIVHLAGAPVAEGRWTPERKQAIYDSRVKGTAGLVSWLESRPQRPSVLVCASAVGFYGDRGDARLTEADAAGEGFLAGVVADWEAAADAAEALGVRVVKLRIGIVLSAEGGALSQMLPPFRLGLGGPMGSGRQWFPWVHIDDVLNVIEWALTSGDARGAYNLAAPGICAQRDFARALGGALGRPARIPVPRLALKLAMGELADEALLASQRVIPDRLAAAGYSWAFPELSGALADVLG
jgi:uncharacterized protein (TIGR01777 family)